MGATFPYLIFHQYESASDEDALILFSAPARCLASWAGIPRKGWHIRMLFQRPVSPSRRLEIKEFWKAASSLDRSKGHEFIPGPNAITIAIQGSPEIKQGQLCLEPAKTIDFAESIETNLAILASKIRPKVDVRLDNEQRQSVQEFALDPLRKLPHVENDYVFEFALQLCQMERDPEWFVKTNGISHEEQVELLHAMEAITRPAVVVDGQHRLLEGC